MRGHFCPQDKVFLTIFGRLCKGLCFLVEDKHAHYCFTVKANQQTLKEDIAALCLKENFFP
jgi:hypothetical protein